MSFVSRLKQVGVDVLKGIEIVGKEIVVFEGMEPALKLLFPQTAKVQSVEARLDVTLGDIQGIVHQVEAASANAGGLTGEQKLKMASNLLGITLNGVGKIDPKLVGDETALQASLQQMINSVVAFENAFKAS